MYFCKSLQIQKVGWCSFCWYLKTRAKSLLWANTILTQESFSIIHLYSQLSWATFAALSSLPISTLSQIKVNPQVKETSFFGVGAPTQQHHLSSNHFSPCFYAHEPQVWGNHCKCPFYWKQKTFCKIIANQLSGIKEQIVSPVEIVLYSHLETFDRGTRKDRWTLGLYRNFRGFLLFLNHFSSHPLWLLLSLLK